MIYKIKILNKLDLFYIVKLYFYQSMGYYIACQFGDDVELEKLILNKRNK